MDFLRLKINLPYIIYVAGKIILHENLLKNI